MQDNSDLKKIKMQLDQFFEFLVNTANFNVTNGVAMSESTPCLPRLENGIIFDFFDETIPEPYPAIIDAGDRGFICAKVADLSGKRIYSEDARFFIPADWKREEFFTQLLTLLVSGLDADAKDAFGMYFADEGEAEIFSFYCRSQGTFLKIGTFPTDGFRTLRDFLDLCFYEPLFNIDFRTGSVKHKRF